MYFSDSTLKIRRPSLFPRCEAEESPGLTYKRKSTINKRQEARLKAVDAWLDLRELFGLIETVYVEEGLCLVETRPGSVSLLITRHERGGESMLVSIIISGTTLYPTREPPCALCATHCLPVGHEFSGGESRGVRLEAAEATACTLCRRGTA